MLSLPNRPNLNDIFPKTAALGNFALGRLIHRSLSKMLNLVLDKKTATTIKNDLAMLYRFSWILLEFDHFHFTTNSLAAFNAAIAAMENLGYQQVKKDENMVVFLKPGTKITVAIDKPKSFWAKPIALHHIGFVLTDTSAFEAINRSGVKFESRPIGKKYVSKVTFPPMTLAGLRFKTLEILDMSPLDALMTAQRR